MLYIPEGVFGSTVIFITDFVFGGVIISGSKSMLILLILGFISYVSLTGFSSLVILTIFILVSNGSAVQIRHSGSEPSLNPSQSLSRPSLQLLFAIVSGVLKPPQLHEQSKQSSDNCLWLLLWQFQFHGNNKAQM